MADYPYERSDYEVMVGNDFKTIYGNREKSDSASLSSISLFAEVGETNTIPSLTIVETTVGSCDYQFGTTCIATSVFEINSATVDPINFIYLWTIESGSATIDSGTENVECTVSTPDSQNDETFILKCHIYDTVSYAESELTIEVTHVKTSLVNDYDDSDVLKDSDTNSPVTAINKLATMNDFSLGNGDMEKSVYDNSGTDGIVDDSEKVNGLTVETAVPALAVFTDTTYSVGDAGLTEINFTTSLKTNYDAGYAHSLVAHAPSNAEANDANATLQGNTFNGISQLVQTDGSGKLPAIDGSSLTGLSSGFADPMTTIGDLIFKNASNLTTRLPIGTVGQVLISDGTNISWGLTPAGGQVDSVVAGTNVSVDITDPINPIVSSTDTTYSVGDGGLTEINLTTALKTNYDTAYSHSQASHADVYLASNNVFTAAQRGEINTLTYSANITPDFALSNRYKCVLTGNTVIENPTNLVVGQGGVIYIEQDVTGSRTTTWGTYWKFANTYTEDTSASKVNIFGYEVYSSTQIVINFLGTI